MKFVNYLKDVENVQLYPAISLIIFILVFILVIWYTFTIDKKKLDDQGEIPLK